MALHFEELKQVFKEQEEEELNEKKQHETLKREKLKADTEYKNIQNRIYYEKLKALQSKSKNISEKNNKIFFITIFVMSIFSILPVFALIVLLSIYF